MELVGNALRLVREMLKTQRSFDEVERAIEETPLDEEQKSAIWLAAYSESERRTPVRMK